MLMPCFDPGLDWNTLSGLGFSTNAFLYPKQPTALHRHRDICVCWAYHDPVITILHSMTHTKKKFWICIIVVIRCLWFLLLSTSSLVLTIILSSSWRAEVNFARYLKSTSLLWPSQKNVSKFDNPVHRLLNHLAVLWDQDFNPLQASDSSADFLTL